MRWFRRVSAVVSGLLVVLLIAAAGSYLTDIQTSAGRRLRHEFAARAVLAEKLTSNILSAAFVRNGGYAKTSYGGAESSIQAAADAEQKLGPTAQTVVLANDGRVLGSVPHGLDRQRRQISSRPEVVLALKGTASFSRVVTLAGAKYIMLTIPFTVAGKVRVWTSSLPLAEITNFMIGNLASSNSVPGGRALVFDREAHIIAAAGSRPAGTATAERALIRASSQASSGNLNGDTWVAVAVTGSPWRIVLSAPTHSLLAPLSATRTVAWQVFSVFAAAILCALGLAAFALRSAHRLAYARLHDELTGLPNRQVFMKRAEQALAQVRLRGGHLATLFIDLDQFKPINDEHGHAAGDVVLAAVAARLKGSVRSGDLVSRFGGDEFLVLCSALVNREQALEIAQRIQGALSQPFQIDGTSVTITASIGVAFHSSTDLTIDVDSLVGYADLAMYEAKKQGRAGIEMMDSTAGTPVS